MSNNFWFLMYLVFLGLLVIGIDALFFNLLPTKTFSSAFLSLVFIVVIAGLFVFLYEKIFNRKK